MLDLTAILPFSPKVDFFFHWVGFNLISLLNDRLLQSLDKEGHRISSNDFTDLQLFEQKRQAWTLK